MSLVLIISILIRLVALAWSVVLLRRLRDWRIGFLSVMLALMAARQLLTLLTESKSWQLSVTVDASELLGFFVSIIAFLAILFLAHLLTEHQRTEKALRWSEKSFHTADATSRQTAGLTEKEFRRRFCAGLIVAWLIPPATGELGMCFLGFWDLRQAGLSLLRFSGIYIVVFTLVAYVVCKRQVLDPVAALADDQHAPDVAHAKKLRTFPWIFGGLLGLYCSFGPATVLLSNAVFEGVEYTLGQYALSMFGVIPFMLVAAFPMFFYLTDLLGRFLAPRGVVIVVAPVWLKVTVLGLFTPVMIDVILLLYYFDRTGFLAVETLVLWFLLILTAAAGTLFAFRSFRQGLFSLKQPLGGQSEVGSDAYPIPRSLDEFGLLAHGWADLLDSRDRAEELQKRFQDGLLKLDDWVRRLLLATSDFQQFYNQVCAGILQLLDADISALPLVDESGGTFTYVAAAGAKAELLEGRTMPVQGGGLCGWVAKHGKTIRVSDLASDPRVIPQLAQELDVNTGLLTPLMYKDKIIGGLSAFRKGKPFDEVEEQILNLFGQSVSIALDNLRQLDALEQHVTERTAELQVTNAELDAFAYSVSHDLRAPLRAMHGFAEALLEDYADRFDAEGRRFAEKIVAAAYRMEELIQDLLTFSRIGRAEINLTSVDLTEVVDECLIELEAEIRQRDAQFTVARPLPMARGHRTTVVQIVRNLVSNAVKFVAEGERPQVRIWAESQNGRIVLSIKDNGIGILPAYHERIFQIFERLHGNETYPGTGIGLAIVRRAAESLGGRVGLESSPGEGSRIWVELPSAE